MASRPTKAGMSCGQVGEEEMYDDIRESGNSDILTMVGCDLCCERIEITVQRIVRKIFFISSCFLTEKGKIDISSSIAEMKFVFL